MKLDQEYTNALYQTILAANREIGGFKFSRDYHTGAIECYNESTGFYCSPFWRTFESGETDIPNVINVEFHMDESGAMPEYLEIPFEPTLDLAKDVEAYFAAIEAFIKSRFG